jgi:UDP:flavonoid glycosyltransferase YjiC (YdhE family)
VVRRFDIVMITDARLPGGTSASVAEEVRAQAAAGYRTGLLQIDSPLVRRQRPMSPRLRGCLERGEMELLLGDEPIEADLVLLRHPTVAGSIDPGAVPEVRAERRLMVANQAPATPSGSDEADQQALNYLPHEVADRLEAWLDGPVDWVPIGPLVRADLATVAPDLHQLPSDWVNIIDVAAWRQPRDGALHRIPVIGRHSRDHPLKWPASREEVLQVYPATDDVEVHVLGGERRAKELFDGRLPLNWLVHPFGSLPPERFLAGIDVYVYYHHPDWIEAFGRSILEALASGAPTVLPRHFEVLFEDAATYAEPEDVMGHVRALHGDRARYRAAADQASQFVAERFGYATHVRRLAPLTEPTGTARSVMPAATPSASRPMAEVSKADVSAGEASSTGVSTRDTTGAVSARRRVLFVSSNGAGVGHLMRLMAFAKHAPDDVEPLFLTFSQGAKVVDDAGYFVEYLASRSISGATAAAWHPMLRERVNEIVERYDVRAMVFDGTWPYQGFLDAAVDQPSVGLVWSRRAMWKPGVSNPVLDAETDRFDLVIEPGEFAADEDRGATRQHRSEAVQLGPVSYLGLEELLEPAEARAQLGLDPDKPAALVNLGAGNINDTSSLLGRVVDRLAEETELQVCVTRSIIADRTAVLPENMRPISVYPLARYLGAFDLAFAASGYNSYHELIQAAVPTAFVPNTDTATDDQAARSRFADRVGVGIDLLEPSVEHIDAAVRKLMDPAARRRMHERAVARRVDNGARKGMEAIVGLIDRGPTGRPGATQGRFEAATSKEAARSQVTVPAVAPAAAVPASLSPTAPAVTRSARTRLIRRVRGMVGRLLRALRPAMARVQAEGPLRELAKACYHALPSSMRARVNRTSSAVQPPVRTPAPISRSGSIPVPPGNVLADGPKLKLPRVAVVLPNTADTQTLTAVVDHLAQLQAASRSFSPLIITSDIDFRPLRRYGYLFEYLPPRDRWGRLANPDTWLEARQRRLRTILSRFAITSVITLPEPEEDGIEGLRALLSSVVPGVTEL